EQSRDLGPVFVPKPMTQIDDDPRKEPGLGRSEKEPDPVELRSRMDEPGEDRQDSPRNHYSRDPASSAPTLDEYRARDLQQKVTDKKDSRAKSEDLIREVEIFLHPQRGVGHVDSVQERHDEQQNQVRHDASHDPAPRPIRDRLQTLPVPKCHLNTLDAIACM